MPVLHVRALPQKDPVAVKRAMSQAGIAIAAAYGCKLENVWVTWQELAPGFYAEGLNTAIEQPTATHPPICDLICFEGKSPAAIEAVLTAAANALTEALEIPDNVFITYREAKAGEVIAGDGIVRRSY